MFLCMPWYVYLNKENQSDELCFSIYFSIECTQEYLNKQAVNSEENLLSSDTFKDDEFLFPFLKKDIINYFKVYGSVETLRELAIKSKETLKFLFLSNQLTINWLKNQVPTVSSQNFQEMITHIVEFTSPNMRSRNNSEHIHLINYLEINGITVTHNTDIYFHNSCSNLEMITLKSLPEQNFTQIHCSNKTSQSRMPIQQASTHSNNQKPINIFKDLQFNQLSNESNDTSTFNQTNPNSISSIAGTKANKQYTGEYFKSLFICDTVPSLLDKIDITSSYKGNQLLREKLSNLIDFQWIGELQYFINTFSNCNKIRKLKNLIKEMIEIGNNLEEKTDINPDATFYMDRSGYEAKSIYSKTTLEESSITNYRSVIHQILNIKKNQIVLSNIKEVLSEMPISHNVPSLFKLKELLNRTSMKEINDILLKVSDTAAIPMGIAYDPICFVVTEGIEDYLDVYREIYKEKIEKCQQTVLEIIENRDLEIHLGDRKEICIKSRWSKQQEETYKDKLKNNRKNKENRNIHNNNFIKEEVASLENTHNRCNINQILKAKEDKVTMIKSTQENNKKHQLHMIKETKHHKIYSNSELNYLNKIIGDLSFQIIEIEGKICKSLILDLKSYFEFFNSVFEELGKLDCLISCLFACTVPGTTSPIISNKIRIKGSINYLIPNSVKTNYTLQLGEFYLITGENMSGKSSYIRNLAHIIVQTRLGLCIKCDYIEIPIFEELYFISTIEHLNSFCNELINKDIRIERRDDSNSFINRKNEDQIMPNVTFQNNKTEQIPQDTINNADIKPKNEIKLNTFTNVKAYSVENYKTPLRIVLVDELQCSIELQERLIDILLKIKITTLFVTHSPDIVEFLKSRKIKIYRYEDFTLQEGANSSSSVKQICKRFFPEILEK